MPTTTTQDAADDVDRLLAERQIALSARIVDLNLTRFALHTNVPDFAGYRYFSRFADADTADPDGYRLNCVDIGLNPVDKADLDRLVDRTFRAKRMRTGFYLSHHFGTPAWIVTRDHATTIFGQEIEKIVWTYYVKHLLTAFAADRGVLHLKGAGVVSPGGEATLLFGRGSGGKTVFLTQACLADAWFLTNTHVIIDRNDAFGVPSVLRVRDDACFGAVIRARKLEQHLQSGEYLLDPSNVFEGSVDRAPIRNLCIIDFHPDRKHGIHRMEPKRFYQFLDQFAFPPSTYGLKDDLLAHYKGDIDMYLDAYGMMKAAMRDMVESARLFHVNIDMLDPRQRDRTLEALFT